MSRLLAGIQDVGQGSLEIPNKLVRKGEILGAVRGEHDLARIGGSAPSFISGVALGK